MENNEQNVEVVDTKVNKQKHINTTTLENNSKPHFMMRIAGGLIDLCMVVLVIFGLYYLFSISPMGNGLRFHSKEMRRIQDEYKVTELIDGSGETFGHKVYSDEEGYSVYTDKDYPVYTEKVDETTVKYYVVVDNEVISEAVKNAYKKALNEDEIYRAYNFEYKFMEYGITCLAGFISSSIFLLTIPLVNKRRATLGKLFAGTMLVHNKVYVPAKWYQVLGRFAWILIIEMALPYMFLSGYTILIMPVVIIAWSLINRKTGRTLHDIISVTKVIDKRTFVPLSEQ